MVVLDEWNGWPYMIDHFMTKKDYDLMASFLGCLSETS